MKNYAKTLRLTSDQLKLLDLKPGLQHPAVAIGVAQSQHARGYWESGQDKAGWLRFYHRLMAAKRAAVLRNRSQMCLQHVSPEVKPDYTAMPPYLPP